MSSQLVIAESTTQGEHHHELKTFEDGVDTSSTSSKEIRKKVLLISDCPADYHCCGVTRKQKELHAALERVGHYCRTITPDDFRCTLPLPHWGISAFVVPSPYTYWRVGQMISQEDADFVCIMSEAPLGWLALIYCYMNDIPISSMRCSRFDLHVGSVLGRRAAALVDWSMDMFHSYSSVCITPSISMADFLRPRCANVVAIHNGCDTKSFSPDGPMCTDMVGMQRPIWLSVGRVCREKNIKELLDVAKDGALPGTVCVVGTGGDLTAYKKDYTDAKTPVRFLGWKSGTDLEEVYRSADVFVFTSLTDTFGNVMVEAMASGLPVAAHDVIGPHDIVTPETGCLHDDLLTACRRALRGKNSAKCIARAKSFSWDRMCLQFYQKHHEKVPKRPPKRPDRRSGTISPSKKQSRGVRAQGMLIFGGLLVLVALMWTLVNLTGNRL